MSTYTPIASQTASGSEASVTFSSLPQGYTDLVLVFTGSVSSGSGDLGLRFNSDTGSNYSVTWLSSQSGGISGRSSSASSITATEYSYLDNVRSTLSTINFASYSNTTTYKTIIARSGKAPTGYAVEAKVGLWRSTSAITSITVFTTGSNPAFSSGSTFSIYGIQVGNAAQKAQGGNIVVSDGTYMYHAFTSSGTFIPSQAISADVLCVAGGGGGGGDMAGGGGAGGLLYQAGKSLTAKSYPVIVGAGGTGNITDGSSTGVLATNGSDSVFGAMTAIGGGAGRNSGTAISGGSGGGSARAGAGGSATQGNSDGATGYGYGGGTSSEQGSGGGGAGAAGGNGGAAGSGAGGAGGVGFRNSVIDAMGSATGTGEVSSSNYYFAGGGGGSARNTAGAAGAGGLGGGGAGTKASAAATSGTRNTGGGGGGGSENGSIRYGGAGGSGIVIIRYAL